MRGKTAQARERLASLGDRTLHVLVRLWAALGFLFVLAPLALVVWLSLFENEIPYVPPRGYTLRWFQSAFENPEFSDGFLLSLQVALVATAIGLAVSIPATLALRRSTSAWGQAAVQLLTAPLIVPTIVVGAGIYVSLIVVELVTSWSVAGSFWTLCLAHVLLTIPWAVRLLLANLEGVDPSIEEAAASLGATPAGAVGLVTLPLIRSGVVAAALFSFVASFGNIELSLFLVAPGRTTLPIAILQYLQFKVDPTVAAVSVVQIAIITAALLVCDRFVKLTKVV
ncbi:ABC transporter permease [Phenylobacterium sp.]|uniref:ABC transporter permease n=1 Tax=Phenylobacterium sp. TaxID=1871053 RepID=UPI001203D366|nr:ABC transporter permease [Phenylobacterium sp.]THD64470.1 MAG: ABC transporter permease [Phenylobacterium sp.]